MASRISLGIGLPVVPSEPLPGEPERTGDAVYPLSFAQERLWFLDRLEGGSAFYNIPRAIRIGGELDVEALERGLGEVIRRHEVLRARFRELGGAPVQVVGPVPERVLAREDLSGLGEEEREAAATARAVEELARPFDLAEGPPLRGRLLRLGAREHVLLLTVHHIVSDGWSMGVLFRELGALYGAYRDGGVPALPELPLQYGDYAAWQREHLAGEVLARELGYWRERLAGAPALLGLPLDHPRPALQTHRGALETMPLAPELLDRLSAWGRREGATLYMVLLGVFQLLLSRYAGSDDVVVGTPVAGRTRADVEELVGCFVNTLVLRTDLGGDPTFRQLLRRVREVAIGAFGHQELPFERLVAELQPERSLSHAPLFQVLFALETLPRNLELPGHAVAPFEVPRSYSQQDLSLLVDRSGGGARMLAHYNSALFERATIRRMLGHLARLLEQVAEDPERPLSRFDPMPEAERRQVLAAWNGTAAEYPSGRCLHELFEAQAATRPGAPAAVFAGETLTYGELNARANRLAHHLRGRGVGPDARVALCVERGLEMMIGLLGVLKAGGAYVPLDPAYPAERLRYVLEDASPAVLLTQASLAERFGGVELPVVALDGDASSWAHEPARDPERTGVTPEHLAYVIYTSGSTGRPKGVMNVHRGVVNLLWSLRGTLGMGPADRLLAVTTLAFDISVLELFLPLASGARVEILDRAAAADPALLREAISAVPETVLQATPATWRLLADAGWEGAPGLRALSGGEALPAELAARVRERAAALWNVYGPTETTIWSTVHPVEVDADGGGGHVPIGAPLANTRVYVLDRHLSPVPPGVAGELYIGGAGVARGYLGRPALTAERFVADPFAGEPGARLYRTGDLVRWRAEGTLEFLGRSDHQVKLRGFRIEPGEIEARLLEHPGVREAVVVVREDSPGDQRLVAYWAGAEAPDGDALRRHLASRLPEHMVPTAFVRLDALPLTPNGKVDRRALPAPEGDAHARGGYEPPLGETEAALAEIWSEVLGVERVGRRDHFFELGGHSLLVIRVLERMRRRGLHADVRTLFATPALAAFAAAVGADSGRVVVPPNRIPAGCERITPEMLPLVELSQEEVDAVAGAVPGGAANVQDVYPLAPLQEGILFHHLVAEEGDPYLLATLSRFDTRARLDAYLDALRRVVARHDILRTAVLWEGVREPVQVVWREAPLAVEEVTLDPFAGDAGEQLYRRFDPRSHRLDVRRAPMLSAHVARDGAGEGWLLLLRRHHLALDHAAAEVLREEIEAHLEGHAAALPAPLPFRGYVAQARLGVGAAEHEAFFRRLLGDVTEPTAPFGLVDARGDGSGIAEARLPVEGELARRLRERARALGVSAASIGHVAWALVLARAAARDDVVFGTVLFGRVEGGEGAERVMGPFVNTLPVRIRVGDEGVEATVRRTHALLADLLRHEHASLALAQRSSGVEAPAPLFTALLNYRHGAAAARDAAPGGAGERIRVEERTNYPLSLSLDDFGDRFRLMVRTREAVDPARVCAMVHRALEGVVEALEEAPARPAREIDVLPDAERARVMEEWNATAAAYPAELCIHDLIEARAAEAPDAVAVVFEGASLSYGELNRRANRLAHHLRALGVRPDARVGICVERSLEMVVGVLGVMKAGGAYVPLDPSYPVARLLDMVEDAGPMAVLTEGPQVRLFDGLGVPVLDLDGGAAAWAAQPAENPARGPLMPDHVAYVIYTSGSTGRPKGVMHLHRAMVNRLTWMRKAWEVGPESVTLQNTSFSFDVSVWEILLPLSVGARLVLARPRSHRDLGHLVDTLRHERVTMLYFVWSFLQLFLEERGVEACTSVRRVLGGGEALTPWLVRRLYERLPQVRLHNCYGPGEAAVAVTGRVAGVEGIDFRVPIGRPSPNMRLYLLDARGEPVPVGVVGELYIGGVQLARGYLGRPGATAERFVPDWLSGAPGARLYRSGDLGRWHADGVIEFLGRNDDQVKIRGFRIELGEIEARLVERPGVREAVAVAREDTPGDRRLVAYYVADGEVDAEALRAWLSTRLPEYMVPAAYVRLESLPLNPNHKLDRKALPAPAGDAYARRGYEAPQGETEAALAEIWSGVLGVERVGRWDHFFELGGHSLVAVQVASRIRQVLGVEAALGDLFTRPVLAELARGVAGAVRADLPPIEPVDRGAPLPLSFAQQRLWFLERLGGLGSAYHLRKRYRLHGALDPDALRHALDGIVARHESLRTTFRLADGEPVQWIAPAEESAFHLVEHDLAGRADADAALRRLVVEEAEAPFDLERGPLIRGRLVRLAADDHVLLLTMHHVVADAWSIGVLARELGALYGARLRADGEPLPPLPLQYADYAAWQRRWIEGEVLRAQGEYWRQTLAGAPELLELPTDRPRPARQDHTGAFVPLELGAELTAELKALARRHRTTLFTTLLAGWAVVLSRLSGQDDVVVGAPTANRGRTEIEGLIGFFLNTLALRVDLSGRPTAAELLARVKERTLAAQHHQDIPFEQVVELLQPVRSLAHTPLFQVMLTWQNAPREDPELPGLTLGAMDPYPVNTSKLDLSLNLQEADGRIVGGATYARSLFERATVERHLGYLRRVLEEMVADDRRPADALPMLPPEERRQVVEEFNALTAEYPRDRTLADLFEAQVERTPDAVAVVYEGALLSYAELNRRANRLAHELIARGVRADERVGLCVERSLEMEIGLLAVLKAGGAYVPLDPSYPAERLRYMLEDSTPPVALTQSRLRGIFAGVDIPMLMLDTDAPTWAARPETNPARPGHTPDSLAYVIYTSGSTGRPKGVLNLHRGLVNRLTWAQRYWTLGPGDATLQQTSLSFDGLVREAFWPLLVGARVVYSRPGAHLEPAALRERIASERITTVNVVPSLLDVLVDDPGLPACRAMRRLILGGESLPGALAARVRERLPHVDLNNTYGPSEAATVTGVPRDERDDDGGVVPIGRPMDNTQLYLLDPRGEPVPVGVTGELHIGGAGVARGYLGRPALTAERFVPDPFSRQPGARMYRTGDLGRWRANGMVDFLGRTDFQVKIRGIRVEPGEIETLLNDHPQVHQAVVTAREDTPGDIRLVAYYVESEPVEAEALRRFLRERLPEHMVPAAYVRLDAFPLTPSRKLDRKALPAPEDDAYVRRGYEAPEDEFEAALAEIWEDVLGVERVGRWDHFFELGGHSLLATKLTLRINQAMKIALPLTAVFEFPVLAQLAERVVDAQLAQFDPEELARIAL